MKEIEEEAIETGPTDRPADETNEKPRELQQSAKYCFTMSMDDMEIKKKDLKKNRVLLTPAIIRLPLS